jgi:hypothetical protein
VASEAQKRSVVILYEHALLGEGLAKYLRAQIGIEATLGSTRDPSAVKSALALNPGVVIFESNDPFEQFDLATLITRGSAVTPCVAGLEQILQAVRDSSSTLAGPGGVQAGGTGPIGTSASPAR